MQIELTAAGRIPAGITTFFVTRATRTNFVVGRFTTLAEAEAKEREMRSGYDVVQFFVN